MAVKFCPWLICTERIHMMMIRMCKFIAKKSLSKEFDVYTDSLLEFYSLTHV